MQSANEYISGFQYPWDHRASIDTISDPLNTGNAIFDDVNFFSPVSHHQK